MLAVGPEKRIVTLNALDGIKVVDLSRALAGPWAAMTLGDMGADVIKVEEPGHGVAAFLRSGMAKARIT